MLGWPKKCELAHAFLCGYNHRHKAGVGPTCGPPWRLSHSRSQRELMLAPRPVHFPTEARGSRMECAGRCMGAAAALGRAQLRCSPLAASTSTTSVVAAPACWGRGRGGGGAHSHGGQEGSKAPITLDARLYKAVQVSRRGPAGGSSEPPWNPRPLSPWRPPPAWRGSPISRGTPGLGWSLPLSHTASRGGGATVGKFH
jgi:hypothetical protein